MHRILRSKVEGLKNEVVEFAQALVLAPSPSFAEGPAAELVEARLRALGYDKVVRDEVGNVVGVIYGRQATPAVLLASHLDTVAEETGDWGAGGALSGRMENGRLHGLGASDCKGGLAAQVYAGALLKRALLPLKGSLAVAATVAEETGRSEGVRHLMEKTLPSLGITPSCAILGEPTDLGLYYGHDGWLEFDISVEGANPFHVDDAARAIFTELDARGAGARGGSRPEALVVYEPQFENAGGVRRSTIRTARRLVESDEVEDVAAQLRRDVRLMAKESGEIAVNVLVREEEQMTYTGRTCLVRHVTHAWQIDPFHPLMERARQTLTAADCPVRAGKWELGRLGMGTAGGVLVREYNVPTLGYGPGREDACHRAGEYVETDKITQALYGTAAIVHGQIGVPVFGWTSDEI